MISLKTGRSASVVLSRAEVRSVLANLEGTPRLIGVLTDRTLPVLPALALGLLLPNLDRLGPLLSTDDGG